MTDIPEQSEQETQKVAMNLRYDKLDAQFASQFIVNSTREEIIVNFSPGPLVDPGSKQQLLPINLRVAMTPQGAARLAKTLTKVLRDMQAARSGSPAEGAASDSVN
jgi:hypothetical protein